MYKRQALDDAEEGALLQGAVVAADDAADGLLRAAGRDLPLDLERVDEGAALEREEKTGGGELSLIHIYLAVKLATELRDFGEFRSEIAPSFRPSLEVVGKPCGKIDGAALVSGEPVFVEDKVPENAWCLHVLRSPFASAYIKSINTSEAEKLPGVAAILTAYNTPETHYMPVSYTHLCPGIY